MQQIIHESKNNVQTSSPWFTTDTTYQLDVLGHNGDTFHMNGHQVHVLKQSHEVSFSCLLQCSHCGNLKAEIALEVSSNFLDQTTKWRMADHQLHTLLVVSDLTKRNGAGMEMVWMACRPGQLVHRNSNKNVAQALTQLHILVVRCEVMRITHDTDGLPELRAQGDPRHTQLLFLA